MNVGTESEILEFKKSLAEQGDGIIAMAAIMNKHGGGELYFGVRNDGTPIGMEIGEKTLRDLSQAIGNHIEPKIFPDVEEVVLDGKHCIHITFDGNDTPYFAFQKAYIRVADENRQMTKDELESFFLEKNAKKSMAFDTLPTQYNVADLTFINFNAYFKRDKGLLLTETDYESFGLCDGDGRLNNAGIMFSDQCPLLQSRVFCTRWDGLDKAGGLDDAVDDAEYEEDLLTQLSNAHKFVMSNSKTRWKKMSDHRVNRPDYADRAVFETLCNALMHRDYRIIGSEIHVDIFDDRLEIYSPGGMPDGSTIKERNIEAVPSKRRNTIIAEIFHRLDYVERRGSGLKKIRDATAAIYGYTDDYAPSYISEYDEFHVILRNMNYGRTIGEGEPNREPNEPNREPNEPNGDLIKLIAGDGKITYAAISEQLGMSRATVQRHLQELKKSGAIVRVGGTRGHWEVR
jgi:predicted HTH transcriptional regulator